MPKAQEIAILEVNGTRYSDWETVQVVHAINEPTPYRFRFTASEGSPLAKNLFKMQVKPGMECSVTLAGQLAITGIVSTRQAYYDAHRHYVEIQGGSKVTDLSRSSFVHPTMELNNATIGTILQTGLAPTGIPLVVRGGALPNKVWKRFSIPHGDTIMSVFDDAMRSVGLRMTSDANGAFVVLAGTEGAGVDALVEGVNILEGREIIYDTASDAKMGTMQQAPGNNQDWGAKVASVPFFGSSGVAVPFLEGGRYIAQTVLSEHPPWDASFLTGRASTEQGWQDTDEIRVWITVYGWQMQSGALWEPNKDYMVVSPMLVMNQPLTLRCATFLQDDKSMGTITQLELCNPLAMHGFAGAAQ